MEEFNLINKYFLPLCNNSKISQNLQDDVAFIPKNNSNLVVSKDIIVQDVHFKIEDGAQNVANRLIRSNLSDIAASGAKATNYLLGFCKNQTISEEFIKSFSDTLKEVNKKFNISLIGGDTVNSKDKLFFSITIFGEINDQILSRKNAKNKELIFVSGNIGDAYLGRKISENAIKTLQSDEKYLKNRYFKPDPRIDLGQELLKQKLSNCAIDISDGLLADLKHICQSSNLSATIFQEKIPLSNQAKNILTQNKNLSILDLIAAGDDYELIFTVNELNINKINLLSEDLGLKLTNIGYFEEKKADFINLFDHKNKINIQKFGYQH